jgi:hypothetical protein
MRTPHAAALAAFVLAASPASADEAKRAPTPVTTPATSASSPRTPAAAPAARPAGKDPKTGKPLLAPAQGDARAAPPAGTDKAAPCEEVRPCAIQ